LLSGVVTACGQLPDLSGKSADVPISRMRVPMTAALRPYYRQAIAWAPCGGGYQCGDISAPLSWLDPGGKSIRLALIKHDATGKSIGSLLVNPGGPGGSGVEFVGSGVGNAVDGLIESSYDVIGFDPRGVGASTPVKCFTPKQEDDYLYRPTVGAIGSTAWVSDQRHRADLLAKACAKNTGSLIAHVDTISAAHDMDLIRSALGEQKLNYLGYSYGTYLGTDYAGLYPSRVGRMVFDGADDPWSGSGPSSGGGNASQVQGFEGDLDLYLASCIADDARAVGSGACPFKGSLAAAEEQVSHLLAAADKTHLRNFDGRELDSATLATAIETPLYNTVQWPELTAMLAEYRRGDAHDAFVLADEYNGRNSDGTYDDNSVFANLAIGCLESGSLYDLNDDAFELQQFRRAAPILGEYAAYGDLACSGWRYGPTPFPKPISAAGTGPILVVGTTGDPATPYFEAKALAAQLDGGHLVTFHGEGHTAYDEGHACVNAAVDAYLLRGVVPARDPDCH
jgi:pimeloyl-ACP methyl ester carboxylesterase